MIYINELPVNIIKFNGGEIQVNLKNISLDTIKNKKVCVRANIKTQDDIFALIQTKSILDKHKPSGVFLYLPRIPYAQSDRAMTQHECSGLKIFATILNSLNFESVHVDDPHSDVSEALINNIIIKHQSECILPFKDIIKNTHSYIISPDGGALKKIYKCSEALQLPVIEASKQRDVTTGSVTRTSVNANGVNLEGTTVLIVDDILDGGRTFIELAKVLKEEYKVKQVDLYITHGIFAKGFDLPFIDNYYVYHLWKKENDIPFNVTSISLF